MINTIRKLIKFCILQSRLALIGLCSNTSTLNTKRPLDDWAWGVKAVVDNGQIVRAEFFYFSFRSSVGPKTLCSVKRKIQAQISMCDIVYVT